MVQSDSIDMFPVLDLNRLGDVLNHMNVKHNKISNVTGTLWHAKGLIDDTVPFDMKFIETNVLRLSYLDVKKTIKFDEETYPVKPTES